MPIHRATAAAILASIAGSAQARPPSTTPFPTQFNLSTVLPANGGNGANGFVLNGIDANDRSGRSVSSAGDVNGDSIDDLIIGAFGADPNGQSNAGESYVVFGRNLAPPPPACPGNANGDGIVDFNDINAVIANWLSNYAPGTGPGDANNDGIVDFNDINAVIANWLSTCP